MITLYLSGRGDTAWQAPIYAAIEDTGLLVTVIDVSASGVTENLAAYTRWCLMGIGQSDIVYVNMEDITPIYSQSVTEIGIARAMGKFVIMVDELIVQLPAPESESLGFARECADVVVETPEEGHAILLEFLALMSTAER